MEEAKMMTTDNEENKCKTCYGYGLWAIGDPSPMGPMDAGYGRGMGMPTIPCPECKADANPTKKNG